MLFDVEKINALIGKNPSVACIIEQIGYKECKTEKEAKVIGTNLQAIKDRVFEAFEKIKGFDDYEKCEAFYHAHEEAMDKHFDFMVDQNNVQGYVFNYIYDMLEDVDLKLIQK